MKWHFGTLPQATKSALDSLSGQSWLSRGGWYLAGGTALALQTGHRRSVDLDFFTEKSNFSSSVLLGHFKSQPWKTSVSEDRTVYGELGGAKISFIAYPFFVPKQKFISYGYIKVLDKIDVAAMKIIAISQRGRKRDFFDLYWCAHNIEPLETTIKRLKAQYPSVAHDYHHILKSLVYFSDAEIDPNPAISFKANWREVKKFFSTIVPQITSEILKLH